MRWFFLKWTQSMLTHETILPESACCITVTPNIVKKITARPANKLEHLQCNCFKKLTPLFADLAWSDTADEVNLYNLKPLSIFVHYLPKKTETNLTLVKVWMFGIQWYCGEHFSLSWFQLLKSINMLRSIWLEVILLNIYSLFNKLK